MSYYPQGFIVSILILLEVVLEGENRRKKGVDIPSFNPYFAGSSSGSSASLHLSFGCNSVSILILLEVVLEALTSQQEVFATTVSILILLEVVLEAP